MAKQIETREIWICDVCHRRSELTLNECLICGKGACYICSHQLYDVWHTNICKNCVDNEAFNAYFMDAHRHWLSERKVVIEGLVKQGGAANQT